MAKAVQDTSTRERLLDEAEFLFTEKGYHAVAIRAVTRAAECILAAVNYHFDYKTTLYQEVFRTRWAARARRPVAFLAGQHDDKAFRDQLLQHTIAFSLNGLGTDFVEGTA